MVARYADSDTSTQRALGGRLRENPCTRGVTEAMCRPAAWPGRVGRGIQRSLTLICCNGSRGQATGWQA